MQTYRLSMYMVSTMLFALLLTGAGSAFAQTPADPLTEEDKTRVLNLVANMSNRNEATIERLSQISDRMGERFNFVSLEGYDSAEGWILISAARESITKARGQALLVDDAITTLLGSENPLEGWAVLRNNLQTTKADIETAKGLLLDAMTVMEGVIAAGPTQTPAEVTPEAAPQAQ